MGAPNEAAVVTPSGLAVPPDPPPANVVTIPGPVNGAEMVIWRMSALPVSATYRTVPSVQTLEGSLKRGTAGAVDHPAGHTGCTATASDRRRDAARHSHCANAVMAGRGDKDDA